MLEILIAAVLALVIFIVMAGLITAGLVTYFVGIILIDRHFERRDVIR